jgi:hypothetical protein
MAGAATPSGLSAATYAGVHTAKTTIPDRYIGPWPFTVTREQAVCDLNDDRGRSAVRRALDRLRSAATSGRDRRKWRALLHGKSLDEQLWTVPPPRGGLGAGAVHDWARRTLAAAGYDAAVMLLEWEIFWRRKGL